MIRILCFWCRKPLEECPHGNVQAQWLRPRGDQPNIGEGPNERCVQTSPDTILCGEVLTEERLERQLRAEAEKAAAADGGASDS